MLASHHSMVTALSVSIALLASSTWAQTPGHSPTRPTTLPAAMPAPLAPGPSTLPAPTTAVPPPTQLPPADSCAGPQASVTCHSWFWALITLGTLTLIAGTILLTANRSGDPDAVSGASY